MKRNDSTSVLSLRVAAIARQTHALGPGLRAALWVQGCPFHCKGCLAPEWLPFTGGIQMTTEQVVKELLFNDVTGLTFSGGEPMEQAHGLAEVARLARQIRELNIICFTGYRYDSLRSTPPSKGVNALLEQIDVLIDSPYIAALHSPKGLRGSSNQNIIHLTSRLKNYDLETQTRQVEIAIENNSVSMIGIPSPSLLTSLNEIAAMSIQKGILS